MPIQSQPNEEKQFSDYNFAKSDYLKESFEKKSQHSNIFQSEYHNQLDSDNMMNMSKHSGK